MKIRRSTIRDVREALRAAMALQVNPRPEEVGSLWAAARIALTVLDIDATPEALEVEEDLQ